MSVLTSGASSARRAEIPWSSPVLAAAVAVAAGIAVGVGVAAASPAGAIAAAAGLVLALAVVANPVVGLHALVVVASLLPFGVIPVNVGVQLTIVDALLVVIFLGWLARVLAGQLPIRLDWTGRALVLFLAVACAALAVGALNAPLGGPALRSFLKYAAATALFPVVGQLVRSTQQIRRLARTLIASGGLAAIVGLVLHSLPRATLVEVLSSLRVVGYPAGPEVLRFIPAANNTYSDVLRATGTSIDPNVFGGMLMLAAALALAQMFDRQRVLPRPLLVAAFVAAVAAMVASASRGSWVGLAAGAALVATVRHRRLWLLAIPAALAMLFLPAGHQILERLASGFAFQDRAAALRLDEYRQAAVLIARYPALGVGFGDAPEAGTFVGVSSTYLLVAEQTGVLGLSLYVAVLGAVLFRAARALRAAPDRRDLIAALLAPFVGALVVGLADHYFMNPRFPHMVALFWLYAGLLSVASTATDPLPPRARSRLRAGQS